MIVILGPAIYLQLIVFGELRLLSCWWVVRQGANPLVPFHDSLVEGQLVFPIRSILCSLRQMAIRVSRGECILRCIEQSYAKKYERKNERICEQPAQTAGAWLHSVFPL